MAKFLRTVFICAGIFGVYPMMEVFADLCQIDEHQEFIYLGYFVQLLMVIIISLCTEAVTQRPEPKDDTNARFKQEDLDKAMIEGVRIGVKDYSDIAPMVAVSRNPKETIRLYVQKYHNRRKSSKRKA